MFAHISRRLRRLRLERTLRAHSPVMLSTRLHLLRWYLQHEAEISLRAEQALAGERAGQAADTNVYVFSYWNSGLNTAPKIVQRCVKSHREFAGDNYVFLNSENVGTWIVPPQHIQQKAEAGNISPAHYSDVLRLMLLQKYGGTWIDSTVLMTAPLSEWLPAQKIFVFERDRDPLWIGNWFIHCASQCEIVSLWCEALIEYWKWHEESVDYYLCHLLFETILVANPKLLAQWNSMPAHKSFWPPHELFSRLGDKPTENVWNEILAASPVHKLTHKPEALGIDPLNLDTFYAQLSADLL